jgi:hypothetical protein
MKYRFVILLSLLGFVVFCEAQENLQCLFSASGDDESVWISAANDGNLILGGNTTSLDPDGDVFIIKTDQSLNFQWEKYFGGPQNDSFREIIPYGGGYLVTGDTWSYQAQQSGWIVHFNSDFTVQSFLVIGQNGVNQFCHGACTDGQDIYAALAISGENACIVQLDPSLNLKKSWQLKAGEYSTSNKVTCLSDGRIVFSGSATDDQTSDQENYFAILDPLNSDDECNAVNFPVDVTHPFLQSDNIQSFIVDFDPRYNRIATQEKIIDFTRQVLCQQLPVADFSIPDEICEGDSILVENNSLNGADYSWFFEGGIPPFSQEEFPGPILYGEPGHFEIKLIVENDAAADSLIQFIAVNPFPLIDLGEDRVAEPGETILLDAGPGMDHYYWQDGSTEQTFEVTGPGEYWIRVEANGCYASDTIRMIYSDCTASLFIPN